MTQPRKVRTNRAAMPVARVATNLTPAMPRKDLAAPTQLPMLIWLSLVGLIGCVQAIVLWFTPYTYLLDEIKVELFFIMGPLMMLLALGAVWMRLAPLPPRAIGWGLLAYGGVICLSTLLSAYPWIGKFYILFTWASAGFFLMTFAVSSYRNGSWYMIRYLAILLLVEVLIGFFMCDLTSSPEHHSGVALLKSLLYGNGASLDQQTPLYSLLDTLVRADDTLQSTILNREFFADFCCMLLPFAYLLALRPGPSRNPSFWRWLGGVTAILGSLAVFWCKSKGAWIMWVVSVMFLVVMLFKIGFFKARDLARHHLLAWLIGIVILVGGMMWLHTPALMTVLRKTQVSLESRQIIWGGAWRIFMASLHNIILGGGPGTFRIYFSAVRRPDYYLHGINNVTTLSHNYFLDVLSETGVLGMLAFGIFLGGIFALAMRHVLRHKDQEMKLTLLFSLTGLAAMIGCNMTSPSGKWVIGATPLWTVMGVVAGLIYQAQKGPFNPEQPAPAETEGDDRFLRLLPESVRMALPQLRVYVPIGLFFVACFMMGYGYVSGTAYFASQKQYAMGFSYLEAGSNAFAKGNAEPDMLVSYFNESIKYFNNALDLDPTNTSAYYKLGSAYTSLAQIDEQIARAFEAKGQTADARSYGMLGDENLAKAKEKYEKLMAYDPDYAEIHYNMGIIYQLYADMVRRGIQNKMPGEEFTPAKVDDYEKKALDHLEKMGLVSSKPEVATLQAQQYIAMGHIDKARDVLRTASHRPSAEDEMIKNYYNTALRANDYASACDALELLWLRRPARNEWLDSLVQLARQNHFDKVLERVVQRLEHINPIHPRLFEAKIELAQRQGKSEEVLANMEQYIKVGGQDLEMFQLGVSTAEKLGRTAEAREIDRQILKVDPDAKTQTGQEARKRLTGTGTTPSASPAQGAAATTATAGVPSTKPAAPPAKPSANAAATSGAKAK